MQGKFDHKALEEKWIKRWEEAELFKAKVMADKPKFYLTVAYPYPSGSMHVGHGRTYTVPDVIARYKRMRGYNVLFPMAWHVTGSPVIGIAERIKKGDEKTLYIYGKLYRVPEETLKTFTKAENIVKYFSEEYKRNMTQLGFSIDWSREFLTITPQYSKFIEWQYKTLYEKGLVVKGKHAVRYCPRCDNPVGDHDLLEGENASILEFTIIKFKILGDECILPAATLRPETIFGVTNMWVNPRVRYVKAKVDKELWIISKECAEKLKYLHKDVEIVSEILGEELLGKSCINPLTNEELPILPASFVDPDYSTGIVMSVPAHAPYDFVALEDLKKQNVKEAKNIAPKVIIKSKKYDINEIPAEKIVKELKIESQADKNLEKATEILYRDEFTSGVMIVADPEYRNMKVSEAREKIKEQLLANKIADIMYEFSEKPVVCRCGTKCVITVLKDQWFLKYSDEEWKNSAKKCLETMIIVPEEVKGNFYYFIDWLQNWACTRKVGLGTKLPWDKNWIIEPLSDSTIYMAYYTIAHYLREIDPEKLTKEFFDYVFLGDTSGKLDFDKEFLEKIRKEFEYWYPLDIRFSAKDLVGNHLTFHIFHHTAIFPEEKWPRCIVVFGMGLLEGQKMSSSKGNIILLQDALDKFGSDTVRLFLMSNAEPWQDFDWQNNLVESTRRKLKQFFNLVLDMMEKIKKSDSRDTLTDMDRWMLSRLHIHIKETIDSLEKFQTRKALQACFFNLMNDVQWYLKRTKANKEVLRELIDTWIRLLAPFTPFICEELWEIAKTRGIVKGKEKFVSIESYPIPDESKISELSIIKENMLLNLISDISNILQVTKVKAKKIYLYLAPEWKRKLLAEIKSGKQLAEIMQIPEFRENSKEAVAIFKKIRKEELPERILTLEEEYNYLRDSIDFLEREFGCEFVIEKKPSYDPENKSKVAMPMKPGIYIES